MGSVAQGEVGIKKSLWGMNQGRRKNTAERERAEMFTGKRGTGLISKKDRMWTGDGMVSKTEDGC